VKKVKKAIKVKREAKAKGRGKGRKKATINNSIKLLNKPAPFWGRATKY